MSNFSISQTLSYSRLTNGLDFPDFDEGRTDFAFDDVNMDGHVDNLSVTKSIKALNVLSLLKNKQICIK